MSYRKLEVNGATYEYVVGRSHVKVRGPGFSKVIPKSEVGQPVGTNQHAVSPGNIRDVVLGRPGPKVFRCARHDTTTTRLAFDPYSWEIEGKGHLVMDCEDCLDASAMEI